MTKKLLFFIGTKLGWLLVHGYRRLTRVRVHGLEHLDALKAADRPFIVCMWHGRLLLVTYALRRLGLYGVISEHGDGEILAQTLKRLGWKAVRGSSTRGGRRAAAGLLRVLRDGESGALTPDGPTGPAHVFKPGAIVIARRAGAALVPATFSCDRPHRLSSWDRFMIWKPFSRSVVLIGKPEEPPSEADDRAIEEFRKAFETRMIAQEREADAWF